VERTIGVLAVQGAFERHAQALTELGHGVRYVRALADLEGLGGLVLPGGESTVQLEMIGRLGLEPKLGELFASGAPVLATCAGLILLGKRVSSPAQRSFGVLDIDIERNAWGRQLDSFEAESDAPLPGDERPLPLVFIRAPRIVRVGPRVKVLAAYRGEPVLVREGNVTGATFHPELTGDLRLHAHVFGRAQRGA